MTIEPARTTEKTGGPRVKQFSVFLRNKVGALLDLVKMLNEHAIQVLAVSVQDSADAAIVRIIVSDPEHTERLLTEHENACSVSSVVVAELKEGAADLAKLLTCLLMAEVNLHTGYALLTRPRGSVAVVLHVEDDECASAVLESHSFRLLSQADISR